MVRETSGAAIAAPIPVPELGISLRAGYPYRVRIAPVSRAAHRAWVVRVVPVERSGVTVRFRHLTALGKRREPGYLTVAASRILGAEPIGWAPELTLSEGAGEPNGPPALPFCPNDCDCTHHCAIACPPGCTCPRAGARDITPAPRKVRPETEHRWPLVKRVAPADAQVLLTTHVPPPLVPVAPLRASVFLPTPPPPALARLLVEHRADCLRPDGCDLSRGLWAELVALYGTPAALGAFYAAERWAETRRARVSIRAALAIAPATRKRAHL